LALSYYKLSKRLPSSVSDIELWNSFVQGNQEALGLLFKRYYSLLYQYGTKICADRVILEDAIQELFAELWLKKPSQEIQSVRAYLLQALKYKLYKSFRDKKTTVDLDENNNEHFEFSHENFLISKHEDEERIKRIVSAINQLPSRQKEIIYLRIYKGLSYEEITEIMGINYQVVRNLFSQALKTFRKLITATLLLLSFLNT
jgi:RNA polymerase sigma factor (sigma-70 family)